MDFDFSVSKSFKTVKDEIVIVLIVQLVGEIYLFVFVSFCHCLKIFEEVKGNGQIHKTLGAFEVNCLLLSKKNEIK